MVVDMKSYNNPRHKSCANKKISGLNCMLSVTINDTDSYKHVWVFKLFQYLQVALVVFVISRSSVWVVTDHNFTPWLVHLSVPNTR